MSSAGAKARSRKHSRASRGQNARTPTGITPSPEATARLAALIEENHGALEGMLRDHATAYLTRVLKCREEEIAECLADHQWGDYDGYWLRDAYGHHLAVSDPVFRSRIDEAVDAFLCADIATRDRSSSLFAERDREHLIRLRKTPAAHLADRYRRSLVRMLRFVDEMITLEVSADLLKGRVESARDLLVAFRSIERDDQKAAAALDDLTRHQLESWVHIARCIALVSPLVLMCAHGEGAMLLRPELIGESAIARLAGDRAIAGDDTAHRLASVDLEVLDFGQLLKDPPNHRRQWRALARFLLREPGRLFGRNSGDGSADLFVPVPSGPLYRLVARDLLEGPGWQGWLIMRGSNLPEGGARWWLGARAGCRLFDGRTRSICAVHPLGALSRRNDEAIAAARAMLPAFGAEDDRVILGWQELARIAPGTTPVPAVSSDAPVFEDPADLIPGFYCAHEQGRWTLNDPQDALLLSCSSCGGERIAFVPLHRAGSRRFLPPIDQHYLARERFYRWLDDPSWDPGDLTLEALALEPPLSVDPRDYADGVFTPPPEPPRTASLEDALAARRRIAP